MQTATVYPLMCHDVDTAYTPGTFQMISCFYFTQAIHVALVHALTEPKHDSTIRKSNLQITSMTFFVINTTRVRCHAT